MTTTMPSERAAARAYLRLLAAARAVLDDPRRPSPAAPLLAAPLAEADEALMAAALAGNEQEFLRLVAVQALGSAPADRSAADPAR
ncbi:hypothetical protein [Streptomyces sp. AK02-01A]|uniref:hypothetical protein n=1 Tax=Streptomyces sp. AK02-01A TaxID=3028648 RepID=UPI0029A714F2|nr:hypothetical protein [Streptomyces sp. AK02-01A]MDX3854257.1 hypothetical protein [Streptomyces sp. AK02-01A]